MENSLISILILNYNGKMLLKQCLGSIFCQNYSNFEVILADNNSSDDSISWTRENYPQAKIIEYESNFGFAGGNNRALQHAKGEWIFFLNNDAFLEKNCLGILAERIKNRKLEQLAFAPLMLKSESANFVDSAGDILYPWGYAYRYENTMASEQKFSEDREIAAACCGAAVFNKDLLMRLQGFDDDFFLYYEDVDLSLRARHSGAKIQLVPNAKVFHKGSATIGKKNASTLYYIDRNRFWTKLKNFPLVTLIKYAPHSLICSLLSLALWTRRGFFLIWLKSRFDMLRKMPKMLKKRKKIFANSKINTAEFESWLLKESFFKWLKTLIFSKL
jgi:GT2 family glycosyltransferase